MKNPTILIAESDEILCQNLKSRLLPHEFDVIEVPDETGVLKSFQSWKPDLIIIGASKKRNRNELNTVKEIRQKDTKIPLILVTRHSSEARILASFRAGVNDYFKISTLTSYENLVKSIRRNLRKISHQPLAGHKRIAPNLNSSPAMIGKSTQMQEIKEYLVKVATTDSTLLVTGETGTGKELVAEFVHMKSQRHNQPFICVNCAALPESLIESEMFGYERGAFTGAVVSKPGKFEQASGGSILLDEIGDLSANGQAKILGALEKKTIQPLGAGKSKPIATDVRIIAATNKDIEQLIAERRFREDLYFRLNVARVHLPPLRDRKEDILNLVEQYIHDLNRQFGLEVESFTEEALMSILNYDWPGNIRELKNLLEATFINRPSNKISFSDLPKVFQQKLKGQEKPSEIDRNRVLSALLNTNWNKAKAAQKLNISRMTIYRKMEKYGIISRFQPK